MGQSQSLRSPAVAYAMAGAFSNKGCNACRYQSVCTAFHRQDQAVMRACCERIVQSYLDEATILDELSE